MKYCRPVSTPSEHSPCTIANTEMATKNSPAPDGSSDRLAISTVAIVPTPLTPAPARPSALRRPRPEIPSSTTEVEAGAEHAHESLVGRAEAFRQPSLDRRLELGVGAGVVHFVGGLVRR